ncbi:adhesion G protein-coupled receptor B2 isoform X1 [Hemibagrus wyckioides]|uniref:adhesion G protein-coupled receptor B2 isoform X1 n=1 Tax=Hemibagrus wyckioides TaxID=337641 RepID=UPI00266C3CEA|nr:adhesion G protein-coupled receptor B2 isoform X1 [Hemibagrus wyckioides]XP_058260630.1 adhesion G protein-coupled receptor B2 isoform X1 [Hemibagrus wyckioides]XP_058260631.1 adhesion G protein-coupled receptor B2 isoform X1 [Hemibagrus wyckioides]
MNTAAQLCLRLLSSLLTLAWVAVPLCQASPCSSLVAGVLYGSFSLRDLFPGPHGLRTGCSWTVENPDPTKYTLYFRFNRHAGFCLAFSPLVLPLDHYLANQTCGQALPEPESIEPCQVPGPHAFLQFDKNFVQLCLAAETKQDSEEVKGPLSAETLDFRLVEVLLINNENSSQFTCGVLCRWFEECLRSGSGKESEGCGITQTGCVCPNAGPPVPILPATPHNHSLDPSASVLLPPTDDCCVTQLHGKNGISNIAPRDVHQDFDDDEQKVKTQRPRSADQPGVFQAQTGDPAAEEWSQWSVCSLTCGQGWQVRTRSCVSSPYGTLCSGPLRETRLCNNTATCPGEPQHQAVEGQWLDWAPWSRCSVSCGTGTQQRQRRCSVSVHGWAECKGPHSETRECTNKPCDGGGNWGAWNQWSLCSKTCDSGWQRRFRMCEGTGVQNYPCDGTGEEVRSCNDKKCPAPHEICKDEYQGLMTWKRASAGETVYNKCPTNATGSASRRCLLDANGVAYWGPPSFARCISLEYRYLHLSLREHLAKGQRTLAGEGMSQIVRSLLELMSRHSYYSGDLLFSVEILRNVTDTFKRATYIPAPDDVQKFFQIVSLMLDMDNLQKWEDAHQVSPGATLLMRVVEDFIHLIGEAQKPFQSFLAVTTNLIINIQREPVSAVSSDINFPMKGRRGMKDWARSAEDKLFIPKEVFSLSSDESDEASYFVIGAILYRTLGFILPPPKDPLVISSKILSVTVRPQPKPTEPVVVVELAPLLNGTSQPQCVVWDHTSPEAAEENWDAEGCKTLPSPAVHTKCLCSKISTFAVLAHKAKEPDMGVSSMPSVPLMVGCGVSCMALLILLIIYAASWRYIRSERSIILLNFCLSILASNILILVGQSQTLSKGLCTVTAAFLHFFFLASFCWVLTEAWQSYLAVIGKIRSRLIRKRFLCLGWGLPALVVAVSVGFTRARGYGTPNYCWLSLEGGLLYAFVGPAAVIVLVNMLIGIVVFNKLMSRDGISDKSKKQRAGPSLEARSRLLLQCSKCGVISSTALSSSTASSAMTSLWSSCVVLPLLALTWMSAVLAITDRRSTLFQVLFAVFDSVQGFVIITVHCAMRREVQDAVRCRMGGCKDDSENSPDSCKNGQVQIMTDFEKDVDLACQTERGHPFIFKEVNTCNPASITGTLSRISLDDEDDPKLATHQEGINFSSLPGNIPPPNLLAQVPTLGTLNELNETPRKKEVNVEQQGQHQRSAPVYLCTESALGWARSSTAANDPASNVGGGEGDYMVLPRRTVSLKPSAIQEEEKPLNISVEDPPFPPPPSPLTLHPAESEPYPADFATVDHVGVGLNRSYGTVKHVPGLASAHTLTVKQSRPSIRQIFTSGKAERTRTLPRNLGSANANVSAGSLERKRVRYSELDFEKVMHTRKRHSELYHELNHSTKFHTIDRYSRDPAMAKFKREKRRSISSASGEKNSQSDKAKADEQQSWDSFKTMTTVPSSGSGGQKTDRVELHSKAWDASSANTPDTSEGDFQTEV